MRLLQRNDTGDFVLTQIDNSIPLPYAILSHTWGADADEITFEDLTNNTGKDKSGYKKLRFCAEQAARDGLNYFWIDTCCINKEIKAELSHSINSMFRWYRDSTRCYVYLQDVPRPPINTDGGHIEGNASDRYSRADTIESDKDYTDDEVDEEEGSEGEGVSIYSLNNPSWPIIPPSSRARKVDKLLYILY